MRTPADMPRQMPRTSRRLRIGVLIAVVVLILLLTTVRGAGPLLHELPVVPGGRLHVGVPGRARDQGAPGGHLLPRLLRDDVRQPDRRRPVRSRRAPRRRARRAGQPLPRRRQAGRQVGADRHRRHLRSLRRDRHQLGVEQLGPVPLPRQLRHHRPAVPQGHRLLRLPAAVHQVPARLGLRSGDRGAPGHGRGPVPQRRHPLPGLGPAGHAGGQDPHLAPARHPRHHRRSTTTSSAWSWCSSTGHVVDGATATSVHANTPADSCSSPSPSSPPGCSSQHPPKAGPCPWSPWSCGRWCGSWSATSTRPCTRPCGSTRRS